MIMVSLSVCISYSAHQLLKLMLFSVLRGRDPSAVAVLMEDSASVAGVFLAASAIGLAQFTGNVIYDALGSITIGGRY